MVLIALRVAVYRPPPELLNAGLGDAPKGMSPSLAKGVHAIFGVFIGWKCVKKLQWSASSAWFSLYWGWRCTAPPELPNVGPGDVPKHALLDLGRGVHAFFCTVFGWQCVENHKKLVKECGFIALGPAACRHQ